MVRAVTQTMHQREITDGLEFLAVEGDDLEPVNRGRQRLRGGGRGDGLESLGRVRERSHNQVEGNPSAFAVEGLNTDGQSVVLVGLLERLVGEAAMADEGIKDELHEGGEGEVVFVGPPVVVVEDGPKDRGVEGEIEESEGGLGERQSVGDEGVKIGSHGTPFPKTRRANRSHVGQDNTLRQTKMFNSLGRGPGLTERPFQA